MFRNTVTNPSLKFYLEITTILREEQKAMRIKERLLTAIKEIFLPESLKSMLIPAAMTKLIIKASNSEWQMIL